MAPAIPDRWTDYKPVGQKVEGTRFIAFKVPLREHVSKTVDRHNRLDGHILLKTIPDLGLIIDLTNTKRYYDPNFFLNMGVEYEKLMIPGRETPPKNLVDKFMSLVKNFIDNNLDNDKLIGVHCTHGVNRTGFFICNYMISNLSIEPNEALKRFATARGHKVERNNYIEALLNLMATNATQTCVQRPINVTNWRERETSDKDIPASDYALVKPSNWRNRGEANSKDRFESRRRSNDRHHSRNKSKSPEIYKRDRFGNRKRSNDRQRSRSRSKSPEIYKRDRFGYRKRSNDRQRSRSRSKSPEIYKIDRFGYRQRSNNRHLSRNKSKSPEIYKRDSYVSRRRSKDNQYDRTTSKSPLARKRDSYDSRRRSPTDTYRSTRQPSRTGNYVTDHNQSSTRYNKNSNNSYEHLPEARSENDINRRLAQHRSTLRTDYYTSKRSSNTRQSSISSQRYSYKRNTNNL